MHLSALLYGAIYFAVAQQPAALPPSVTAVNTSIYLDEEADVPAQEGGVIEKLFVKEGEDVKGKGQLVKIDDSIPRQQLAVAEAEWKAAKEQADNQVPKRYAEASLLVAQAELDCSNEANRKVKGAVPQVNISKLELEREQMKLSIEKALTDTKIAIKQMEVKEAQMAATQTVLEHRLLLSPLDGQVSKIYRHVGEWVQTGEAVVHVIRMDRLRVQGALNVAEISPSEVIKKPVEIEVSLARGGTETFRGNIVFVDPMIDSGGEYMVRAEVDNRPKNGQWILHPGLPAKMTILLK